MTTASLSLRQFKSYKEATLPLAPLTVLIGANASGKSNAIEAFRLLSWVAGGERLSTLKNRVNDSDKIIRGSIKDLAFNDKTQFALNYHLKDIDCEYEGIFNTDDNRLRFICEVNTFNQITQITSRVLEKPFIPKLSEFYDKNVKLEILEIPNEVDSETMVTYIFDDIAGSALMLVDSDRSNFINSNYVPFSGNGNVEFSDISNVLREKLNQAHFFDFIPSKMSTDSISDSDLRFDGSNLAGVLFHVCQNETAKAQLLALIQSLPEQNISDITFYPDHRERVEFALVEQFGDTPIERTMDLLSDGTLKVLGIATALLSVPEGSTVVIEEIDNSIHPSRANQILTLMREYASDRQLNLLLSTHNPALMDALPDEALADVVFCYRDPNEGDSRLVRLGDLEDYLGLVSQGSLGDLVTEGVVERFVKHPTTPEDRKQQALDWLKQMQGAD